MNSLIHLSQNPPIVAPERLSSASRLHVSLSHGSLSVSQWCKRSHLVSRPLYVKCTLDRFSEGSKRKEENGKKNNILSGVGRASLVLACVLGAFTLSGKMNPKRNIAYADGFPYPSQSSDARRGNSFFKTDTPNANEIEALKLYAMALSMNEAYADVAERMIRDECKGFENTRTSTPLRLALIELLLYQKKYTQAKEEIEGLLPADKSQAGVTDVPKERVYLLKALAESVSEADPTQATISWQKYLKKLDSASPSGVKTPRGRPFSIFRGS